MKIIIEFNLQNLNVNNFKSYENKGGIYYLQIRFNGQLDNLTSKKAIFEKLVKEWDEQKRIKIPKIEKNKQPKYNKNDLKNK